MHASQLAQIGSWIAIHAPNLVFGNDPQEELVLANYWVASKARLQRWVTALKMFEQDLDAAIESHDPWPAMEIVIEEVIVSEFVTRIWMATMLAHDTCQKSDELFGLAHSVHIGHIEARNRVMRLLLHQAAAQEESLDRLNQLRSKIERWTDVFLAIIPAPKIAQMFAFDESRVADYQMENEFMPAAHQARRGQILMAAFTAELQKPCSRWAANPDLNRKIASSLMNCFPSDRFDSLGLPKSFGRVLLEKTQDDTQVLVDQLLAMDAEAEERPSESERTC